MRANSASSLVSVVVGVILSVAGVPPQASPIPCQIRQIKAAANLCLKTFRCEAAWLWRSIGDPAGASRADCLDRARDSFTKAYDRAPDSGESCKLTANGAQLAEQWTQRIGALADDVASGWDGASRASSLLYRSMEQMVGASCRSLLLVHAADAGRSDPVRFAKNRGKVLARLESRLKTLVRGRERKGFTYLGNDKHEIALRLQGLATSVADATGGSLATSIAVQLPGSVPAASLSLQTLGAGQPLQVQGQGSFSAQLPAQLPAVLAVATSDGVPVAMSMLIPGEANSLSCLDTAAVMTMVKSLMISLPPAAMPEALALVKGLPEVVALSAQLCVELAADKNALTADKPVLGDKLDAAAVAAGAALRQLGEQAP